MWNSDRWKVNQATGEQSNGCIFYANNLDQKTLKVRLLFPLDTGPSLENKIIISDVRQMIEMEIEMFCFKNEQNCFDFFAGYAGV